LGPDCGELRDFSQRKQGAANGDLGIIGKFGKVTEAVFTLVAIDENRRPRPVPPLPS